MTTTVTRRERRERTVIVAHDLSGGLLGVPTFPTPHGSRRGDTRPAVVESVAIKYSASDEGPSRFERPTPNGWVAEWSASIRPWLKSGGLGEPILASRYGHATSPELAAYVEALIATHEPSAPTFDVEAAS